MGARTESIKRLEQRLKEARVRGHLHCDSLLVCTRTEELPDAVRRRIGDIDDLAAFAVVAQRGDHYAWQITAQHLPERAEALTVALVIAGDLDRELNRLGGE